MMGLMDWLFGPLPGSERFGGLISPTNSRLLVNPQDRRSAYAQASGNQWAELRNMAQHDPAGSTAASLPLGTPMTWTIAKGYHPTPPVRPISTHKTRMARLIARRERSGK